MKRLFERFAVLGGRQKRPDHRTESRLPAHGVATVRRDVSGEEPESVNLLGISERGLSFRSALDLAPEQAITIETGDDEIEAIVRHTSEDGQEFIIGAEILSRNGVPLKTPAGFATAEVDKP